MLRTLFATLAGCVIAASAAAGPGGTLEGQEIAGPVVERGVVRLEVAPSFLSWDGRFGSRIEDGAPVEEREPLGFDWSTATVGTNLFPALAPEQAAIAGLLGRPGFMLDLGTSRVEWTASRVRVPFRIDVGVLDRLTVGVTVPLEKRRAEVDAAFLADSLSANVGVNPVADDVEAVDAFLADLSGALGTLGTTAEGLCSDLGESDPACIEARTVLSNARGFEASLSYAYGQLLLFPLSGSLAGRQLVDRVAALRAELEALGIPAPLAAPLPLSSAPVDRAAFRELVTDPAFGVGAEPLETWQSLWELGDVEVHASARILDGERRDSAGAAPWLRWELGAGGLLRLGTGVQDGPANLVDLSAGDGQTDVEVRGFANVSLWRRLGLWTEARWVRSGSTDLLRRVAPPDVPFPPPGTLRSVSWTPGDAMDWVVAPRLHLTPELALGVQYRGFHKEADSYEAAGGAEGPFPPSVLERETGQDFHSLGLGLVYSTLDAWRDGRTGLPFELRFLYRRTVTGSGGATPDAGEAQAGIRVYTPIWGR